MVGLYSFLSKLKSVLSCSWVLGPHPAITKSSLAKFKLAEEAPHEAVGYAQAQSYTASPISPQNKNGSLWILRYVHGETA